MANRTILKLAAAVLIGAQPALSAFAQQSQWPDRPIKIIAPFSPGSATDVWARILAHGLQDRLGQPILVENKTGAGGQMGTDAVAKSPANGYTLLIGTPVNPIQVKLYEGRLPYDFQRDFVPVALLATLPLVLVVGPSGKPANVAQLVEAGKKNPGSITYGSSGTGSSNHLCAALMGILTQTKLTHVPYRGTPAVYPDIIGGNVTMIFDNVTVAQPQIKSGKVRGLLVANPTRLKSLPDVPSSKEVGMPDLVCQSFTSVFVRTGTPPEIVKRLNTEINNVLADKQLREQMEAQGAELYSGGPEVLARFFNGEVERWSKVIEKANVTVD